MLSQRRGWFKLTGKGHHTQGTQGQQLQRGGAHEAPTGPLGWWGSLYLSQGIKEDETVVQTRPQGRYQRNRWKDKEEYRLHFAYSIGAKPALMSTGQCLIQESLGEGVKEVKIEWKLSGKKTPINWGLYYRRQREKKVFFCVKSFRLLIPPCILHT